MKKHIGMTIEHAWKDLVEKYVDGADHLIRFTEIDGFIGSRSSFVDSNGKVRIKQLVRALRLVRKILGPEIITNLWHGLRKNIDYIVLLDKANMAVNERITKSSNSVPRYMDIPLLHKYPSTEKMIISLGLAARVNEELFSDLMSWLGSKKMMANINNECQRRYAYNKLKFSTSYEGLCISGEPVIIKSKEDEYVAEYDRYIMRPLILWNEYVNVNPYHQVLFGFLGSIGLTKFLRRIRNIFRGKSLHGVNFYFKDEDLWKFFYRRLSLRPYGDNHVKTVRIVKSKKKYTMLVNVNQSVVTMNDMIAATYQAYENTECTKIDISVSLSSANLLHDLILTCSWMNHLQRLLCELLESRIGDKCMYVFKPYCPVVLLDSRCKVSNTIKKGKTKYELYRDANTYEVRPRRVAANEIGERNDISYLGMIKMKRYFPAYFDFNNMDQFVNAVKAVLETIFIEKPSMNQIHKECDDSEFPFIRDVWRWFVISFYHALNNNWLDAMNAANNIDQIDYRIAIKSWCEKQL